MEEDEDVDEHIQREGPYKAHDEIREKAKKHKITSFTSFIKCMCSYKTICMFTSLDAYNLSIITWQVFIGVVWQKIQPEVSARHQPESEESALKENRMLEKGGRRVEDDENED
ncbi:hypothetical protein RUM44_006573 [Polyplax serrata]|uniref:Uncharacterized protein n=1 Tax=Polyplax serrata TaxID=468196 RepID=A0ABR1AK06_POLSC